MKIQIKTQGVILTSKQKSQIEKQLGKLKKYFSHIKTDPVMIEVRFIDESGPNKGGVDQAVHLQVTLPKDSIYIEETDDRALRAFQYAYKTLERRLRRYSDKMVGDKRRENRRFKSIAKVVGGASRAMSTAAGAAVEKVSQIVPGKGKRK